MSFQHMNPENVHPAPGFSHAVISRGSRLVHFAGQVALDSELNVVGTDVASQTVAAMRNLEIVATAAGVRWDQIVRRTIYTTTPGEYAQITDAIHTVTGPEHQPAQTIVGITGLAIEGLLIEIECTAVVDEERG
ncbi:Endoribonuclease L-PSP [Rhodococcus sp. AW25M09]|uniref:RidA family protein n=1 Tax=Rhodococcus sp. AW25M09 TaxID=1268303 RepID=UPI0002ABB7DA|nr:RidA family protein [Rhodococcus sp. AW25M09]CCQ17976.1 Endoribonuclease L-PSP [Rhodococcus sp. AW25M09]